MPWLPIYAAPDDLESIRAWLNKEPDIAFLVEDGPKRWKAVSAISSLWQPRVCLWHEPSGPLPLLGPGLDDSVSAVADPWAGWTERRAGADPTIPYFGAGHPGVIWLNVRPTGRSASSIGLSSFEWIGNRYRVIGRPAPELTSRWWQRLQRWIKKSAVQIPRVGPLSGSDCEIWALPEAYHLFQAGTARDNNP
jgi:hypothetical protein